MSEPVYKIVEINDGGDPECDIDTTVVRCLDGGVETKITRVVYSGLETVVRFEFSNSEGFAETDLMCGQPCSAETWKEVLGAVPFTASCAGAEHGRPRFYFVADADDEPRRLEQQQQERAPERAWDQSRWRVEGELVGYSASNEDRRSGDKGRAGSIASGAAGAGDGLEWVRDSYGKVRRSPPGIRSLADGVSGRVAVDGAAGKTLISRVAALKGFGNALDQRAARSFIAACMDILVPIFLALSMLAVVLAALRPGLG